MKIFRRLVLGLLLVSLAGVSWGEDEESTTTAERSSAAYKSALDNGNYKEAVEAITKAANKGNRFAQFNMGTHYASGEGVEKDDATAAYWYELSAKQGFLKAQLNLADAYVNGKGVNKSYATATKWFELAAEQGHVDSQMNLAHIYLGCCGLPIDLKKAEKWARLASLQGDGVAKEMLANSMPKDAEAQHILGWRYQHGRATNLPAARFWYQKAAEQGYLDAQFDLAKLYQYSGDSSEHVYGHMWLSISVQAGHAFASFNLGDLELDMTDTEIAFAKKITKDCIRNQLKDCAKPDAGR